MQTVLLFSMPGGGEWVIILMVALLLFGGKKIPELARGIGRGIREFNDARGNIEKEIQGAIKEEDKTANK